MAQTTIEDRFIAKCQAMKSGCIEWQGATSRHSTHPERGGYGMFRVGAKVLYTHRWVWQQTRGEIPAGFEVDHQCHNRRCCNPEHLRLLSSADNKREANARRYAKAA